MESENKVAIVTGAIKGIGLAIALELSRSGIKCVLPYYDWLDSLESMHRHMKETGVDYHAVPADLTCLKDVKDLIHTVQDRFGRLDILINNIERGGWPVVHGPYVPEQWDLEFETTVTAKWYLFKEALPVLKSQGGGIVVNISSIAGLVGRSGPAGLVFNDCYSLSNRAIQSLTETWARQGAPEVRVNELMLGFVETRHGPATRGWDIISTEEQKAILDHTLLQRTGRIEEVAKMVSFLVFDASFMTGSTIRMDGGYVLGGDKSAFMPKGVVEPSEPTFGGPADPKQQKPV
ncbi:MAG: SDR family oxidoreductase [Deltaproteobacteria bacterium]|nr:SDR family oxidoreductase [Deltaproteobacteria bacterium]MDL1960858.1 SDR family oxidoreductase [Deltaproteobacteria bacterium]